MTRNRRQAIDSSPERTPPPGSRSSSQTSRTQLENNSDPGYSARRSYGNISRNTSTSSTPTTATVSPSTSHIERIHGCIQGRNKKIRDDALAPYVKAARWIALSITPFASINTIFCAGLPQSINNPQYTDEHRALFDAIMNLVPTFQQIVFSFSKDPSKFEDFINQINAITLASKNEDTATLRKTIVDYIPAKLIDSTQLRLTLAQTKSIHGFNHEVTTILLCPVGKLEWCLRKPEEFMANVNDGTIEVRADDWPAFMYDDPQAYDPDNQDKGLCRGKVLLWVYRHIFTGPSSALSKFRGATKASKAEIHNLTSVTGRTIAYAAVQARFALSSVETWARCDGDFDNEAFFKNIVELFEYDPNDEWVTETISWWNENVPSLAPRSLKRKRNGQPNPNADDGKPVNTILAQRKARRRQKERDAELEVGCGELEGSVVLDYNVMDGSQAQPYPDYAEFC